MCSAGCRVRLKGLQAKPELNGREGICKDYRAEAGRWTVCLEPDGAEVSIKPANLEVQHAISKAESARTIDDVLGGLAQHIARLQTKRQSVCDAMIFCMEHEAQFSTPVARVLTECLTEPDLSPQTISARLFLVSDVLHNSGMRREQGGAKYGAALQELLPEAFEQLGRVSLRSREPPAERVHCEEAAKRVLKVWQDWGLFPSFFTKGLEALLLAPIVEVTSKDVTNEPDSKLRQKLQPWFSGLSQAQLPYACRMRGLSGKFLPAAACRNRLCHFERYWHLATGDYVLLEGLQAAGHLNGLVGVLENWEAATGRWRVLVKTGETKAVKPTNLIMVDPPSLPDVKATSSTCKAGAEPKESEDSLDGVPLTSAEWREALAERAAEEAARKKKLHALPKLGERRGKTTSSAGTWTQVWDGEMQTDARPSSGAVDSDDGIRPRARSGFQSFKQTSRSSDGAHVAEKANDPAPKRRRFAEGNGNGAARPEPVEMPNLYLAP